MALGQTSRAHKTNSSISPVAAVTDGGSYRKAPVGPTWTVMVDARTAGSSEATASARTAVIDIARARKKMEMEKSWVVVRRKKLSCGQQRTCFLSCKRRLFATLGIGDFGSEMTAKMQGRALKPSDRGAGDKLGRVDSQLRGGCSARNGVSAAQLARRTITDV